MDNIFKMPNIANINLKYLALAIFSLSALIILGSLLVVRFTSKSQLTPVKDVPVTIQTPITISYPSLEASQSSDLTHRPIPLPKADTISGSGSAEGSGPAPNIPIP